MNVEFDDNQKEMLYAQIAESNQPTGITKFLMDKGWAKDDKQASTIMSLVAVATVALTAYVIFNFLL